MKKTDLKTIANKYAKATFELALVSGQIELVLSELLQLKKIIISTNMIEFINNTVDSSIWNQFISEIVSQVSTPTQNLIRLLQENKRETIIVEVVNEFQCVCDKHFDVARGVLITAAQIDADQIESMQKIVTQRLGKRVVFEHKNNPEILGGVVAKVAGWTFDDSLKTHLDKLTQRLVN